MGIGRTRDMLRLRIGRLATAVRPIDATLFLPTTEKDHLS